MYVNRLFILMIILSLTYCLKPTDKNKNKISSKTTVRTTSKKPKTSLKLNSKPVITTTPRSVKVDWPNDKSFYCTHNCWNKIELEQSKLILQEKDCWKNSSSQCGAPNDYCCVGRANKNNKAWIMIKKERPPPMQDKRIVCRPFDDRMTWYRGYQDVTVRNQICIRWDNVPSLNFTIDDFNRFEKPSLEYSLRKSIVIISDHHNYCRNPDNDPLGPWCYYINRKKMLVWGATCIFNQIARNPCFNPCNHNIKQICLRKSHFPFRLHHRFLPFETYLPFSREVIDVVTIEKHNKVIDLTDLLDVDAILGNIPALTSSHKVGPLGIPSIRGWHKGLSFSTRKKCYQSGMQTEILGPWAPVQGYVPSHLISFINNHKRYSLYQNFAQAYMINEVGRQLWDSCFSACEDTTITCWPKPSKLFFDNFEEHHTLPYYGHKTTSESGKKCLPWYKVMDHIQKQTGRTEKLYQDIFLGSHFYPKPNYHNLFLEGQGFLIASGYCLDLARLLRLNKHAVHKTIYSIRLSEMLDKGPGCFTSLKPLTYSPCFKRCSCPLRYKPRGVFSELCGNETIKDCTDEIRFSIPVRNESARMKPDAHYVKAPLVVHILNGSIIFISVAVWILSCRRRKTNTGKK